MRGFRRARRHLVAGCVVRRRATGPQSRLDSPLMIRTEREGPVTLVVIDRPAARNAVDRETAEALADAFRAFDADDEARVGVLYGDHGTFCAGADLKAL